MTISCKVLVVCENNWDESPLLTPPVLVFEILSPTSTHKDRVIKYQLYENAGVKYYCIVDPENRSVEVYEPGDNKYMKPGDFQEGKVRFDLGECTIEFDFGKIFPPPG